MNDVVTLSSNEAVSVTVTQDTYGVKNNLTAVVSPTNFNDTNGGYRVGSLWLNTISKSFYRCTSASAGRAIWVRTNEITPQNFGAVGDAVRLNDGVISASGTTFTSASAVFTANDVDKEIIVYGAGASGGVLRTTIASFTYTNTVELADAAGTTVSSYGVAVYGTDDTEAIQAAISYVVTTQKGGVVFFPTGGYLVSGELQTSVAGKNPNSQIYIPAVDFTSGNFTSVTLLGEGASSKIGLSGNHSVPDTTIFPGKGVQIYSTVTNSGSMPSVFGTYSVTTGVPFNMVSTYTKGISVFTTPNNTGYSCITGFNFQQAISAQFDQVQASTILRSANLAGALDGVSGIILPTINCNSSNRIDNCIVSGFKHGYVLGEHVVLDHTDAFACENGFTFGVSAHANVGYKITTQQCKHSINTDTSDINLQNQSIGFDNCNFYVQSLNIEETSLSTWYTPEYHLNDPDNKMRGAIGHHVVPLTGGVDPNPFTKNGGDYVRCYEVAPYTEEDYTLTGDISDPSVLKALIAKLATTIGLVNNTTSYVADVFKRLSATTDPYAKAAIQEFILGCVEDDNWKYIHEIYLRTLGSTDGLKGFKTYSGTAYGGITWNATGSLFNGSTGYIDNGIDLSVVGTQNNIAISTYFKTVSLGSNKKAWGVSDGTTLTDLLYSSSIQRLRFNAAAASFDDTSTLLANDTFITHRRKASGYAEILVNGAVSETGTRSSNGIPTGYNLFSGASNTTGTAGTFSNHKEALLIVHDAVNTDVSKLYGRVATLIAKLPT